MQITIYHVLHHLPHAIKSYICRNAKRTLRAETRGQGWDEWLIGLNGPSSSDDE